VQSFASLKKLAILETNKYMIVELYRNSKEKDAGCVTKEKKDGLITKAIEQ